MPDTVAQPEAAAPVTRRKRVTARVLTVCQVALSAGLLAWVFSGPGLLADMRRTLSRADPLWLALGVACGGVWIAAAAYRWRLFLRVQGIRLGMGRLTAIYLIAMFFSLVLPGSVGMDAVRIVYLIREKAGTKTAILFSVMTDHIAGMVAMMVTAAAILFARADWLSRSPVIAGAMQALVLFMVITLLGLALAVVASRTRLIHTLPNHIPFRPKVIDAGLAFGMFARHWGLSLRGLAASFVTIYAFFATFYCSSRAFDAQVSFLDIFSLMPIIDVLSALPVSISGLGVREKLFETMLQTMAGVPNDVAILISLTGFGFTAFWSVSGALVFAAYRRGRPDGSPRHLRDVVREAETL